MSQTSVNTYTPRNCAHCHTPMPGARSDARYCSRQCRQHAYRRRAELGQRLTPAPVATVHYCEWCNRSFWTTSPRARYCRESCKSSASRARRLWFEQYPFFERVLLAYLERKGLSRELARWTFENIPRKRVNRFFYMFRDEIAPWELSPWDRLTLTAAEKTPAPALPAGRVSWSTLIGSADSGILPQFQS